MSFAEILELQLHEAKLYISSNAQKQLALYASEIERWNKRVNLTALQNVALIRRLIVEPVWAGHYLQMGGVLADVGSGNGSPGIPLGITRSFSAMHLIEPRLKRAVFLRHIIAKLALSRITVDRNRIEDLPDQTFLADWISLQAIDPTPSLIAALQRIGAKTTRVVWITSVQTSPVADAEKVAIPNSSTVLWIFRLDQT